VKILVIEDDPKISNAVRRGLVAEGFGVELAADGEEGLWLACQGRFDVIVLDILLPKMNGFRVCAEVRAAGVSTPILMLTAKDGELDETEALDTGADDYLTKPFSFPVLVAHIRALARRGVAHSPAPETVGDLHLDSARRTVRRGDHEIRLTAREFDVLEFLFRRHGQVQSKSDVLAGVWDFDFDGDPNIVEVYIGRLRRKIDSPWGQASIETVRGAGYRVVDDA
jgi:two-component system, OmpR family, response regulator